MIGILGIGLLLIPLAAGVVLVVLGQRTPRALAARIGMVVIALVSLCALGLTAYTGQVIPVAFTWIPGTGTITLSVAGTGLYAAFVTTVCAAVALWAAHVRGDAPRSSVTGVLLVTASAVNAAFLSGHFLGRYVALEVVGACVALVPLLALRNAEGSGRAKFVYLVLRIGDAGFLAAILILLRAGGTLDIADALSAGLALHTGRRAWVIAGFLLAVWVKVGAWPFHGWLRAGQRLTLVSHAWTYAVVMPNLGLYLLYRVTPLLTSYPAMAQWVLWLGAVAALAAFVLAALQPDYRALLSTMDAAHGGLALCAAAAGLKPVIWLLLLVWTPLRLLLVFQRADDAAAPLRRRTALRSRWRGVIIGGAGALMTLFDGLVVWWMSGEASIPPLLVDILTTGVMLIGYRCVREGVRVWRTAENTGRRPIPRDIPSFIVSVLALIAAFGFTPLLAALSPVVHADFSPVPSAFVLARSWLANPLLWLGAVFVLVAERRHWLGRILERVPALRAHDVERAILAFAGSVRAVIELRFLEQGVTWVSRAITGTAVFLHRIIEEQGLESLLSGVVRGSLAAGRGMQRWHTGRLRNNLRWVAVLLLLAMMAVVVVGW